MTIYANHSDNSRTINQLLFRERERDLFNRWSLHTAGQQSQLVQLTVLHVDYTDTNNTKERYGSVLTRQMIV